MIKKELIKETAKEAGITESTAGVVVESLLKVIKETLAQGENITIRDFGKFYLKCYNSRNITTPQGERVKTTPSTVPAFKAGKEFKNACNQ